MPTFIYKLVPTRPEMVDDGCTDEEKDAIERHFAYLQELHAKSVVRLAGRTNSEGLISFGLVLLEAPSHEEADRIMQDDPAVAEEVMTAELFPFGIALG